MSVLSISYLHLLIPTFVELANQGSMMNTHRKVVAPRSPSRRAGLSCNRSPFRNQWTVCFAGTGRGGRTRGAGGAGAANSGTAGRRVASVAGRVSGAADITTSPESPPCHLSYVIIYNENSMVW